MLRRFLHDHEEFRGEVIFTFDGDAAGQKAALRAFGGDQNFVSQTYVAVEPGPRPVRPAPGRGDAAVRALVEDAVPMFEFAVRTTISRFDLDTAEGRVQALRAVAPIVAGIRDRSLRPEYTRTVAGWLGLEVEQVATEVHRASTSTRSGAPPGRPRASRAADGAAPTPGTGRTRRAASTRTPRAT